MAAAAAAAAGVIVAGYLQKRASDNANKARGKSDDAALAYQKNKDAEAKGANDRAWADYQQKYAAWEARNFGGKGGGGGQQIGAGMAGAGPGFTQTEKLAPGQLGGSFRGMTVADLMGGDGVSAASDVSGIAPQGAIEWDGNAGQGAPMRGASLADLARWSDHKQYLGGA